MRNKKGFTLVELAIVLVIIGIILGGILKGQEIIKNAKIKRLYNDYKGIVAAIYTYQDRYHSLPGDDPQATTHLGTCTTHNGDGDGLMYDETATDGSYVWEHLRCAGIIPGSGTTNPSHVFGGNIEILNKRGDKICFNIVPGDVAEAIDISNDDGKPDSGSIKAYSSRTATTPVTSYSSDSNYTFCFSM
ncbi:methylation site [Thermodesulfatator indicus DSM 15286]|uniref:Methylation site n=1 Tax=Thermodesulfatator indicus (strain DSM 15286 / JCM 11887 / CIR29812) TaxID=667014 RepID=F8ACA8_THEID|nr:prepilin-type N-terminal cleavage/methylation domain-containing protein [Thermodesulfatator indicus]AEH45744.1 methylation site [Thermodesulfatator indicus DSM 15286]